MDGEPGGLPSMGSHRVGHDWSDLAAMYQYMFQCYSLSSSLPLLPLPLCAHKVVPYVCISISALVLTHLYHFSRFHIHALIYDLFLVYGIRMLYALPRSTGKPLPLQLNVCVLPWPALLPLGEQVGVRQRQASYCIYIPFPLLSSLLLHPRRGRVESIHQIEGRYWGNRETPAITMLSPHISLILGMLNLSACKCVSTTRLVFVPCNFNNCVIL